MKFSLVVASVLLSAGLLSCQEEAGTTTTTTNTTSQDTAQARPVTKTPISLVLNISERTLAVLRNSDTLQKYPVAVGTKKYPTPEGEFKVHKIDFNPDWTPPESEWTKDKEYTPPGHKDNPMGRARIIYQSPYSFHGTKDLKSLGDAESHGSVRMANADVIALAKFLLMETGTQTDESWFQKVLADSTKMVEVPLRDSIPLRNIK